MLRPPYPPNPSQQQSGNTNQSQPYFDSSNPSQLNPGYTPMGTSIGLHQQQPSPGSIKVLAAASGGLGPTNPSGLQPAPLTFTPSGSSTAAAPSFKNIRSTLTNLSEQYETALGNQFKSDAIFIQNYLAGIEKQRKDGVEVDEKPVITDFEAKPDAEVMALINELSALDTFRQTANQAFWTARHLPQTASSHFDPNFELPPNLDNPTLTELQQLAQDQINFVKRYRKAFSDCITAMAKNVEPPKMEEYAEFLKSETYRREP